MEKKDLLIGLNKPNQNNLCTNYLLSQWNKIVKQAFFTPNLISGTQRAISKTFPKLHFFVDFLALFNTNIHLLLSYAFCIAFQSQKQS